VRAFASTNHGWHYNVHSYIPGDNNFIGSGTNGNYTVLIFVSDSQPTPPPPFTPTTTLPNGVVGSPYTNTVYESGGVTTGPNNFSWTIVPNSVMPGGGSTLPGLSFQPNTAGVTNGTLSGTPTSAGTFTFTAMVTDSAGNTGTQNLMITVFAPATRPAGLVSWWPAEGNYTDIISGNNGAPSGGVGFAPGEVGQAFSFNGVDGKIQVADNANLDVSQITIEAWVKPTTSGHGRPIVQKRSSTNVGGYTFETTDTSNGPGPANGLQFGIWIGGTLNLLQTPANVLTIGAWQHVAATYDGSTMNIYVNGVLQASQALSPGGGIDTDTDPLVMGLNVTTASYDWNGFTDEVSIYNRALTSAEIQSIVNAGGAGKAKP